MQINGQLLLQGLISSPKDYIHDDDDLPHQLSIHTAHGKVSDFYIEKQKGYMRLEFVLVSYLFQLPILVCICGINASVPHLLYCNRYYYKESTSVILQGL